MKMLLSLLSLLLLQAPSGSVSGLTRAADGAPAAGVRVAAIALRGVPAGQVRRWEELEEAWSLPAGAGGEPWRSVAAAKSGSTVYAATMRTIAEIDSSGQIVRELAIPGSPILRLARVAGHEGPVFLAFGTWSRDVRAYDVTGKLLWNYPSATSTGIDDVWPADLDGDQSDEVIVGFNGGTGLHVVNSGGALQWDSNSGGRAAGIGNVWHVSAGDLRGQGAPEIVATSAAGRVHIFSADGKQRRDLNPGFYANMVRVWTEGRATQILVGGGSVTSPQMAGLLPDGTLLWTLRLDSASTALYSAYPASGRPWLAVGLRGGARPGDRHRSRGGDWQRRESRPTTGTCMVVRAGGRSAASGDLNAAGAARVPREARGAVVSRTSLVRHTSAPRLSDLTRCAAR
jgi:hypothetical protein